MFRKREDENSVYLTDLIAATGPRTGFGRYASRSVVLEGRRCEKSLMTEVRNRPDESTVTLSVPLEKRFRRFRAYVGRDPAETAAGPGCAYFEVWGDERRLFLSMALRSPAHLVKVAPGAGAKVRRLPQEIEVSVRGVETLRLVTRYADDFVQTAPQVERARGCVWGDPQLEPEKEPDRPTATVVTAGGREAPIREVLRGSALRLAVATLGTLEPNGPLPLRMAVAPLRVQGRVLVGPNETILRTVLVELLTGARRGTDALFTLLERREGERFAQEFPSRRPERAAPEEVAALTEAARKRNADVVLTGTYFPATAGQTARLTITLLNTRTGPQFGQRVGETEATLPAS
jgi:hypothetical protein